VCGWREREGSGNEDVSVVRDLESKRDFERGEIERERWKEKEKEKEKRRKRGTFATSPFTTASVVNAGAGA
jgi:hypothetical protein